MSASLVVILIFTAMVIVSYTGVCVVDDICERDEKKLNSRPDYELIARLEEELLDAPYRREMQLIEKERAAGEPCYGTVTSKVYAAGYYTT